MDTTAAAPRERGDETVRPRSTPLVAVDTVVLTLEVDKGLSVLLVDRSRWDREHASKWRLPGMFIEPGETLRTAALRALRVKAEVDGVDPRQLHVFDEPDRDARGWTISVAHLDVIKRTRLSLKDFTTLTPVDALPRLDFDHRQIIELCARRVRERYRTAPDPYGLLDAQTFTVTDLRMVHEAVLGQSLNPDTFRRAMVSQLDSTGAHRRGRRGKPAALYTLHLTPRASDGSDALGILV